ncbi:Trm112 family protein [Pedobacter endophyticus]|uniref:Trm112p-like protein n=1 Tax=Pedobacter endophyticus TaxID=2789740 RepID=A0A7S9L226_9SPHI|nr:Trm112 family protein [Pedobacter endophyticus]QPH40706.1 hypothetical protein IZT61_05400 [Pedobacter endophyticus]
MRTKTIEKLCCPFDKQDLKLEVFVKDTDQNILEGMLSCCSCDRKYPIVHGVPIMAPDEYRQKELEQPIIEQWKLEFAPESNRQLPEI